MTLINNLTKLGNSNKITSTTTNSTVSNLSFQSSSQTSSKVACRQLNFFGLKLNISFGPFFANLDVDYRW
ncbi:hypothetical protein CYY_000439 [Polysphondylium violaceum]|uniref:Uncharacterized protein n=1 Tax=Polysphondylium violaceum TaxID=133409 RepID=A0A8J4Q4S8_9MYCE|nr:hypothetical protein CYY_000439 [Polysphondylium violaceum]